MDTTTIFTGTAMDVCGMQCLDILTAGQITLATFALMVLAGVYAFAGICKRIR